MRVFIAEKPELARAIVEGLGGGQKAKGYYDCGDDKVTWCFGHMLTLFDPEDYDPKYQKWSMADLPIVLTQWQRKVGHDKQEQLNIILGLIKGADSIVHAGDPDPEGQLLIDEVIQFANCDKPVKRLLINDNNTNIVKKALANLKDNSDFKGLSNSAEARTVADQLYGYNLTRAYTLTARNTGFDGVLSVGRVQTPVLGLVVRRDRLHESHQKQFYYSILADVLIEGQAFKAKFQPPTDAPLDEEGRVIDEAYAKNISERIKQKPALIVEADTSLKNEAPKLPYNLIKLQTDASNQFGLKPDKVKEITQSLREKHRLITYNRSDCQYLSEEQHLDAKDVLEAIATVCPTLQTFAGNADSNLKSKAFNSSKVSAHHAIIPTQAQVDWAQLSSDEKNIYELVAKRYVAQFFPDHTFHKTEIQLEVDGLVFSTSSRIAKEMGWRALYADEKEEPSDFKKESEEDSNADLRALTKDMKGMCEQGEMEKKTTKPPVRYTMATLLTDLTRVAKYIQDESLRKTLIDKDKDKASESGGIGTPATRDTIIKALFDRKFLTEKGKHLVSTETGRTFYDALPDKAKFPDMTALWHQEQERIEQGEQSVAAFIADLCTYIGEEVELLKKEGLPGLSAHLPKCPECQRPMRCIKGKKGFFWGCSGFQEGCKKTLPDKKGEPDFTEKPKPSQKHTCKACGKGLIRREAKSKGRFFWGCSAYPECKQLYFDCDGKPNYETPPPIAPSTSS